MFINYVSVQSLSRVRLLATLSAAACQASLSITGSGSSQTPVCRFDDVIQPSHSLSSPFLPLLTLPSVGVLFSESLGFQFQRQSFQWIFRMDFLQSGLVGVPCSPGGSQESFPTPQFKNINSLVLSFRYSPPLTSIRDYRKNHSFD